ncbi:MAG TPA: hypothetical protein VF401_00405 [Candidatus Saccharimonadales bacterium]
MRELQNPEDFTINGEVQRFAAGAWVVKSAFEAELLSQASKHAPGAMTARLFTHYQLENHHGRIMSVRMPRTTDELEFWEREVGRPKTPYGYERVVDAHGPLVLKPQEARLVEAGLEVCAQPPTLGEPVQHRAIEQRAARILLDMLAEQRIPESIPQSAVQAVA